MPASSRLPLFAFASLWAAASVLDGHSAADASEPPQVDGSYLRSEDHRLGQIAFRIASAAAPLCPATFPLTGILYHHLDEYEPADRQSMIAQFGLDRGLGVLSVIEDSPAAAAGLVAGDVILSLNGRPLERDPALVPPRTTTRRAALESAEAQIEQALTRGAARIGVIRNGRHFELSLGSRLGCPGRIRLARSQQTNAFANGRYVTLTTAVLAFTQSDDELAIIIAHEMAHNILNHPDRLDSEGVPKGLLRGIGRKAQKVWATEAEADRLGIRLASAAGYDVAAAIPFWRRFYAKFDGPQIFRTHPSLGARERIITETIAELNLGAQRPELGKGALPDR